MFWMIFALLNITTISFAETNNNRVEKDLMEYKVQIAQLNKIFQRDPENWQQKTWIQKKIKHMVQLDQTSRQFWTTPTEKNYTDDEKKEFNQKFVPILQTLDIKNTEDLKKIVAIWGWPRISQFGEQTSRDAWILIQHADHDLVFQRKILAEMQQLYPQKEVLKENYAYLYDRIAVCWRFPDQKKPQLYGTQGGCEANGIWVPAPIENPEQLDIRRKQFNLGPFEPYRLQMQEFCKGFEI